MTETPAKGQVWRHTHASLRGHWRVQSAGPKFVTLKSNLPFVHPIRVPTDGFMQRQAEGKWNRVQ